jgi:AcrR family transcriptional regulator
LNGRSSRSARPLVWLRHWRGRHGGRPRSLTEKDLAAAKALLTDPEITMHEVTRRLGVGPATLYRHLPGGRSAIEGSIA